MVNQIPEELWAETTWDGNRRAQLRRALELTVRERLQAVEDMAEVAQRFQEMRESQARSDPGDTAWSTFRTNSISGL